MAAHRAVVAQQQHLPPARLQRAHAERVQEEHLAELMRVGHLRPHRLPGGVRLDGVLEPRLREGTQHATSGSASKRGMGGMWEARKARAVMDVGATVVAH